MQMVYYFLISALRVILFIRHQSTQTAQSR